MTVDDVQAAPPDPDRIRVAAETGSVVPV
jgi:hypothetical protein